MSARNRRTALPRAVEELIEPCADELTEAISAILDRSPRARPLLSTIDGLLKQQRDGRLSASQERFLLRTIDALLKCCHEICNDTDPLGPLALSLLLGGKIRHRVFGEAFPFALRFRYLPTGLKVRIDGGPNGEPRIGGGSKKDRHRLMPLFDWLSDPTGEEDGRGRPAGSSETLTEYQRGVVEKAEELHRKKGLSYKVIAQCHVNEDARTLRRWRNVMLGR